MTALIHEFSCKLSVSQERAFAALTQADELKIWFAEHVEVEPHVNGAFSFWGKHTYGTSTRADATQKILRWESPTEFAFSWTIHGQPSEVSFLIEVDPDNPLGVVVKGKHQFANAPKIERASEMVDDLWRLHCGNLQIYFGGGSGMLLPDFTDTSPIIRLSIMIDATPDRVFRALMDPDILNKWIAKTAVVEPRVGGRYSFGWSYDVNGRSVESGPLQILELVENEKLVFDWPDWRGDPNVPMQKITWLLDPVGTQTRVTLIHSGFVRTADIGDYPFGWGYYLDRLNLVVQGRDVEPDVTVSN